MDTHGGGESLASDLSLEEVMDEYSSRPPQIAEWLWCIEYVAKFVKDIRCILDLMNMGYQYSNSYGRRINEVLSLRVLEFMFDGPSKNVSTGVASTSEARVEFDLSLSSTDVLKRILEEIPVSELRAGMPELSKFNVRPFIAHKNRCLPQCALEKLREVCLMEDRISAAPSVDADVPVSRDDRSAHVDRCEEEPVDEQQVHIGLEQNINEKDTLCVINEEEEPMETSEKDEVMVIDEDTADEPIRNGGTPGEKTFHRSSRRWPDDARVKCAQDGTWLISSSDDDDDDDESDTVKCAAVTKKTTNLIPWNTETRTEDVCWKCGKAGTLLICSRSECTSRVHKECLQCAVEVDEDGNFHCPVCWYDKVVEEYLKSVKSVRSAKRSLVNFLPLLSSRSKRLR